MPFRGQSVDGAQTTPATLITNLPSYWLDGSRDDVRPIKMEILVNFYDGAWMNLWGVMDGEFGYLRCATKLPIQSGDRILVEGTVVPARGISADTAKITVLARNQFSPALEVTGQLSDSERLKSRVVTFEARFDRESISEGTHWVVDLVGEGRRIHAFHWTPAPSLRGIKQGARLRVTGVYAANHDSKTDSLEIDVWCGRREDIVVLGEPESDPIFVGQVNTIDSLPGRYAVRGTGAHIAGVVRQNSPGRNLVVRDETGEVMVETFQTLPLKFGDWVEAVGEPFTGGTDWLLRRAIVRRAAPEVVAEKKRAAEAATSRLRLIDQVLALGQKEAAAGLPVEIFAVVFWSHPEANFLYVGDTSGTIRVQLPTEKGSRAYNRGTQVRINGVTRLGAFAPEVALQKSEAVVTALLPLAKELTLDQAMTGLEEGRRISMRGHVQRVVADGVWTRMVLSTQTGTFTVTVARDDSLNDVLGSIVSVEGVCRAIPNSRRQITSIEILVTHREYIRVEQPALTDPFTAPLREISALRQFNGSRQQDYWVRVRGVVTLHLPGRSVFIQDGTEGLMLLSEQKGPLSPGDFVEVTGLPGFENGRVVLRESVYRKIDRRAQPAPFKLIAPKALSEELDNRMVSIRGNLINDSQDAESLNLAIEAGEFVFTALLQRDSNPNLARTWSPGSELELTGVYELIRDERRQPRSFHLHLRSRDDVRVLQNPSWWTPGRAFAVTGLLIGCVALGLTWVVVLRRRVAKQTGQLRTQIVKEAKLEAHNRAIVENANDSIFTTDLQGNFTSLNPAGERLLGYSHDEIRRLNLRDLIAAEDVVGRPELIASLAGKDQPAARFELRLVTKEGRQIWTEISACLVHIEGEMVSVLGVARDIGERKQIEDELKRARDAAQANTEAKSAFLANMSHEIRTPMNGVIGMSNMILETSLSGEQREFAETIRNSAESLLTVLNDILDFSKIEAGKLHMERVAFDLVGCVEECLELLAARASEKKIELSLFIPPGLPRLVCGDPGRLRQVLLNLVGNALKFTSKGEVAVSMSAGEETPADLLMRFEVRDSGVGLSDEAIGRLFQPFSQADASTTRRFGGTGLGLVISKQIVQLMLGSIGVTSEPGRGSTFWFTVRLAKQPAGNSLPEVEDYAEIAGLKILTVDDHATVHKNVDAHVTRWGMRGHAVYSAAEAMDALTQAVAAGDPFRIALLDGQLPEADGLVLAETIRKDKRFDQLALIVLTWPDSRVSAEDMTRLKLSDVVRKPLQAGELLQVLLGIVAPVDSETKQTVKPRTAPPIVISQKSGVAYRLLVAEDNAVNQRLILHQLKKLGYSADLVANGVEVIRALEMAPYDLVLMDCQMPEMDGYEATQVIRRDPRYAGLRIVAMTANAMQGDREKCIAAGMDDYLSKPTRVNELNAALARCLDPEGKLAKETRSFIPIRQV